jgi:hypothetical protein
MVVKHLFVLTNLYLAIELSGPLLWKCGQQKHGWNLHPKVKVPLQIGMLMRGL